MALPSSPPLLPEIDPPSSPALFPDESAELPIRPSELPAVRPSLKRGFSDYTNLSSDPYFSEGTSETGEEDAGQQRRRKRLIRGPWWKLRPGAGSALSKKMARREPLRNADSGVFMGSDMSDVSIDSLLSSQQQMAGLVVDDKVKETPRFISDAEIQARQTVNRCVDIGLQAVDISNLGMTELSDETLRPLHHLILQPHTDLTQPPSEDEFGPLTPSIQLFMFGNRLASLPFELFRLVNIKVLSLRNNELETIPHTLARLSNLTELNIAQNNIKWLPWEMLDLMHCKDVHRKIQLRPNPLISPLADLSGPSPLPRPTVKGKEFVEYLSRWGETSGAFFEKMKQWYGEENVAWTMRHELELRLKLGRLKLTNYLEGMSRFGSELKRCSECREQMIYLASSKVRFFDVGGSIFRPTDTMAPVDDVETYPAVVDSLLGAPPAYKESTTPSLFELSLRTAQANFNLHDLCQLPEDLPEAIPKALQHAAKGSEKGNECCSVCRKHFIIARAEWVEHWFYGYPSLEHLTQESILPFLRKACSWACARPSELGSFKF